MAEVQAANVRSRYDESAIDAKPLDVSLADSTFKGVARGLMIGVSGDVEVTTLKGRKVTLVGIPAGLLPLCVKTVHTANTTASNITALF